MMELVLPASKPDATVLVIHSWWGLTQSFRDYGTRLAKAGIAVGLADLYEGQVARSETEARELRGKKRRQPAYKTLAADLNRLRAETGCDRLGVVGFSMGGHWAVWLAQRPEYGLGAAVLYYAARGGNFCNSDAAWLAHFADDDPFVSPSARRGMKRAITRARLPYTSCDYPGTGHWFAESDSPAFDPEASDRAFDRTVEHLRDNLSERLDPALSLVRRSAVRAGVGR